LEIISGVGNDMSGAASAGGLPGGPPAGLGSSMFATRLGEPVRPTARRTAGAKAVNETVSPATAPR
jgi:hypothetical protein